MKLSRYNYKVEYGNKYILFNGVTGCLFSIKKSENKLFETLFRNLDFFEEKQPDLFESIEKMGFIINNSTNEINHILLRNKKAILLDKTYDVFINPTLECNFKCWYCYENRIKGRMNKATIDKLKKHLTFMVEKDRITALNLSWFGGEPLLYFKEIVFEFSLFAKKLCKSNNIPFKNSITSNGFLINKRMIDDFKTINLNRFQITLDGNKEKHDKIRTISGLGTYERIISNIKDLLQHHKDALINLRINYDNNTLKNIDDLYIDFDDIDENNKKQLKFHFQQVWQVNINEDTVKLLNKKSKKYI